MIRVEWNYKGTTDRMFVILPPLPSAATLSWLRRQPDIVANYRKTLDNLCTKGTLSYIVVYVPHFDPTDYDQRCLFEDFYGKELRLITKLERLLDRHYPDYLTSECIYMLADPTEWETSATPIEWYFDVVLCDQMYEYYDSTSKWLRKELPKLMDFTVGASEIYETFLVKLLLKGSPIESKTTKTICLMDLIGSALGALGTSGTGAAAATEQRNAPPSILPLQDSDDSDGTSDVDKDLVFIFGDVEPYEKDIYIELLRQLIKDFRVSAVFSYGNMTPLLQSLRTSHPSLIQSKSQIPRFELYTQPDLSPELHYSLFSKLVKYSPTYTYFMWLGAFQLEKDSDSETGTGTGYKEMKLNAHLRAFIYSPPAWCSLHPEKVYAEGSGVTLTYEPCGMLDFFMSRDH